MTFIPFDPLEFKNTKVNDAALGALKREIENILSSYVGWYDPFCELIQNSLDAVEARVAAESAAGTEEGYVPSIRIRIDLDQNSLTVTDNGIGLDKDKFEQFLAPNFSFKSGKTRGHKGVGATYVAYGFNYMRVSTRTPGFAASGRIIGARNWLKSNATGGNPKVEPDDSKQVDDAFDAYDRGVSVTVRFDEKSHPKRLDWIKTNTADRWHKILSIKTGLGSVSDDTSIHVCVIAVSKGEETKFETIGTSYLWLHKSTTKSVSIKAIAAASKALFDKYGTGRKLPDKYRNLDFLYETWTTEEIGHLLGSQFDEEELLVLENHSPIVSVEYGYTTKLWQNFNDSLKLRGGGYRVLHTGIQLAANNMPQGEPVLVPLKRYTGRQNQVHFLVHFDNYTPDLGRKGFHRELSDFAKSVSQKLLESQIIKFHSSMKANSGASPDLAREIAVDDWMAEMLNHEAECPLQLTNKHFFLPIERVSITSVPTREQDVIALFHQLIAGGVVRGLNIMSTNERFIYDGLFRISFDLKPELFLHDTDRNPLGVSEEVLAELHGKVTQPRVLEYKFSLDGLVEDFDSQSKNIKDIHLCIAWETGDHYAERYGITSLLIPENFDQRQYHGITHVLYDIETGAKHCDLIILGELIEHLNDPTTSADKQRQKYE